MKGLGKNSTWLSWKIWRLKMAFFCCCSKKSLIHYSSHVSCNFLKFRDDLKNTCIFENCSFPISNQLHVFVLFCYQKKKKILVFWGLISFIVFHWHMLSEWYRPLQLCFGFLKHLTLFLKCLGFDKTPSAFDHARFPLIFKHMWVLWEISSMCFWFLYT